MYVTTSTGSYNPSPPVGMSVKGLTSEANDTEKAIQPAERTSKYRCEIRNTDFDGLRGCRDRCVSIMF
jgi:hypothetical protein